MGKVKWQWSDICPPTLQTLRDKRSEGLVATVGAGVQVYNGCSRFCRLAWTIYDMVSVTKFWENCYDTTQLSVCRLFGIKDNQMGTDLQQDGSCRGHMCQAVAVPGRGHPLLRRTHYFLWGMTKYLVAHFFPIISEEYVENYSPPPLKINKPQKYHFILTRVLIIEKAGNNNYWQECGEIGTLVLCWWKCKTRGHCGNQFGDSSTG